MDMQEKTINSINYHEQQYKTNLNLLKPLEIGQSIFYAGDLKKLRVCGIGVNNTAEVKITGNGPNEMQVQILSPCLSTVLASQEYLLNKYNLL
ncbi:MAG: hypothetical protein K0R14_7 [Burkholderiales bacterium]|nr:hypothetical protein [Burkholderiales bacterium]